MIQLTRKQAIFDALYFLLSDIPRHTNRAYIAPFITRVQVPNEYRNDPAIIELTCQLSEIQESFQQMYKYNQDLKTPGVNSTSMKKEIQQMEQEKQQVEAKISKLTRKVHAIPDYHLWMDAARQLRLEQQKSLEITENKNLQRKLLGEYTSKIEKLGIELTDLQNSILNSNDFLGKVERDHKMNKYLSLENLPKQIKEIQQKLNDFNNVLNGDSDLRPLETQVKTLNQEIYNLNEIKAEKIRNSGADKVTLFRQQAAVISRKKETTATQLQNVSESVGNLTREFEAKRDLVAKNESIKIPKGEEFKRYVADLRIKSSIFKQKKVELSAIVSEYGVLHRTEEVYLFNLDTFKS